MKKIKMYIATKDSLEAVEIDDIYNAKFVWRPPLEDSEIADSPKVLHDAWVINLRDSIENGKTESACEENCFKCTNGISVTMCVDGKEYTDYPEGLIGNCNHENES